MHVLPLVDPSLERSTQCILRLPEQPFLGLVGKVYPHPFFYHDWYGWHLPGVGYFDNSSLLLNLFHSFHAFKNIVGLPVGSLLEVPDWCMSLFCQSVWGSMQQDLVEIFYLHFLGVIGNWGV